jgi:tetratricopeptide (TPR) repeat protein
MARAQLNAEMVLGELLSNIETLERRGVQRWAGPEFLRAQELYDAGDKAYLERDYVAAERHYLDAISVLEPLFNQIEPEFQKALSGAQAAFEAGDRPEALRLYELADTSARKTFKASCGLLTRVWNMKRTSNSKRRKPASGKQSLSIRCGCPPRRALHAYRRPAPRWSSTSV